MTTGETPFVASFDIFEVALCSSSNNLNRASTQAAVVLLASAVPALQQTVAMLVTFRPWFSLFLSIDDSKSQPADTQNC
jgi:hypothetical protein